MPSVIGAVEGSHCTFVTDCPTGFQCIIPKNATVATIDSLVCVDPAKSFERKLDATYQLTSNGSNLLVTRSIFVLPYLKAGAISNDSLQKMSVVQLTVFNQGPRNVSGMISESVGNNVSSVPGFKAAFYDPKPNVSRTGAGTASWEISLQPFKEAVFYYSVNTNLTKESASSFDPPLIVGPPMQFDIGSLLGGSDYTAPVIGLIVFVLILFIAMKPGNQPSDSIMRPKILKIKEKLWHHPADWQRNADKLKKS